MDVAFLYTELHTRYFAPDPLIRFLVENEKLKSLGWGYPRACTYPVIVTPPGPGLRQCGPDDSGTQRR